jgi:hypothetical protein
MSRYASGAREFFKRECCEDLSDRWQLSDGGKLVHNFVTPEVIDDRVARLHGMHHKFRGWRFEQRTQFHEVMAGAA